MFCIFYVKERITFSEQLFLIFSEDFVYVSHRTVEELRAFTTYPIIICPIRLFVQILYRTFKYLYTILCPS